MHVHALYKAQVLASEKNLLLAMKTSDVDLLDVLLHDDLLFNGPTGETATKAMDLQNYRAGLVEWEALHPGEYSVSVIGDDVVVAVTIEITGFYMSQPIHGHFRYLRVWKLFDHAWKVIGGSVIPLVNES